MYWLNKAIHVLDKVGVFSRWTNVVGVASLLVMICVTFVDVIMRYIFNQPFEGMWAITEVMETSARVRRIHRIISIMLPPCIQAG